MCHEEVTPVLYSVSSLKGVVQTSPVLQRGPFCKPSTATIILYRPPATPTAANAIDKNICRESK